MTDVRTGGPHGGLRPFCARDSWGRGRAVDGVTADGVTADVTPDCLPLSPWQPGRPPVRRRRLPVTFHTAHSCRAVTTCQLTAPDGLFVQHAGVCVCVCACVRLNVCVCMGTKEKRKCMRFSMPVCVSVMRPCHCMSN